MIEDTAAKNDGSMMRTILVVDDDPLVLKAMQALLRAAAFETMGCLTGAEAMELADTSIDAAVVDIHLPDMNGLDLSRKLRAKLRPGAPILILSGDNSMETIRALPDTGATYFFAKPVNTGMLINSLKEWTATV